METIMQINGGGDPNGKRLLSCHKPSLNSGLIEFFTINFSSPIRWLVVYVVQKPGAPNYYRVSYPSTN